MAPVLSATNSALTYFLLTLLCFPSATLGKVMATQMSARVISTQYGLLRGVLISPPNPLLSKVEAYLGLQYASVLKGELRFMPPTSPMVKWTGIKVALTYPPVCPQKLPDIEELKKKLPYGRVDHFQRLLPFLERQEEDCLNLNIYVPTQGNGTAGGGSGSGGGNLLPVVMFIHGETYSLGTGNAYDGSVLAAYGHVVVVTLNFRMGALGFLSTGDSNAPGNYALLDQVAALHWIKENIQAFGGDKNRITLMGQGYGAAMVHLLLISPVTKGKNLFQRAIIQSGSALSSWAITPNPVHFTQRLADQVNCSQYSSNSADLLQCLKKKPWEELINVDIQAPKYFSAFGPVIDGRSVLPTNVRSLMEESMSVFGDTDVLVGLMKNEGFLLLNQTEIDVGVAKEKKIKILRTYVRNMYQYHRQKIYEIIMHHYSDWEKPEDPEAIRNELMELLGDGQYVAPVMELADYHSKGDAKTFLYSFSYPSRLDSYPRWAGGVHGDDMTYIFGAPLTNGLDPFVSSFTRSEKMLTEAVMTYWTNFIKSGDPNLPLDQDSIHGGKVKNRFSDVEWPIFTHEDNSYLHIGKGSVKPDGNYGMRPTIRTHYRASKMALWLDLIPKIHKSDNLELKYHLLENYDNATTFEEEGTRKLDLTRVFPPPPISPPFPPSTTISSTTTFKITTTTTLPPPTTPRPRRTTPPRPTWPKKTMFPPVQNITQSPQVGGVAGMDSKLSLSVTIAVGCSLLFLNIIIFAGVYYQKDRMRVEMKMCKHELEKEKEARVGGGAESEGIKSSTGPDSDTNSSSMATPPIPPPLARHHQPPPPPPTHNNTMPKTAIPVLPPQAPYGTHHAGHPGPSPARSPRLPNRPTELHHPHHYHRHHMSHPDIMEDGKLRHSSSADSGTDVNNHCPNPSTVV